MKQGKKLKGTNVYMNDHLTRKNAEIARKARLMRRQSKIQNTWVYNCKTFIKLNGPPEEAKVLAIRSMSDLDRYGDETPASIVRGGGAPGEEQSNGF